ncbi:phage terminase large subunit [Sphingomonas kyungheensis]|uniref:Phage terminase large subunit n=1 Tax=Sphingomonas kyungheensis TaxID=1069987 RepID=A0ABU8H435_9SPHN
MPSPSRSKAPLPTFEPTSKQAELIAAAVSPARHILAYGGSRSGKTMGFCYCIATRAMMAPNSRHLIARLHNVDVRQSVMLDTWPKMMGLAYPGIRCEINKTDQYAIMPNGSEVWFSGLDDKERVDKILGKEFATIYVNEASQVSYETIPILRTRLAQACRKSDDRPLALKAYYDLNPSGKGHWTYREFVEGVRPENGLPVEADSRAHVVLNPADNPHLPAEYHAELDGLPDKQRQRFRDGKYLSEVPGALWSLDDRKADDGRVMPGIDSMRVQQAPPLQRIVIGVDPSGSNGTTGDIQGIIVAGVDKAGHGYVLEDCSCRLSPEGWARVVSTAAERWGADRVVAEHNFGGAMVEAVLRSANPNLPVKLVTASRGKVVRAEPVAAFYEQGKAHHVGSFPDLEDQMSMVTTAGYHGGGSPDRMDALVWAFTELMVTAPRKYDMRFLIATEQESNYYHEHGRWPPDGRWGKDED